MTLSWPFDGIASPKVKDSVITEFVYVLLVSADADYREN